MPPKRFAIPSVWNQMEGAPQHVQQDPEDDQIELPPNFQPPPASQNRQPRRKIMPEEESDDQIQLPEAAKQRLAKTSSQQQQRKQPSSDPGYSHSPPKSHPPPPRGLSGARPPPRAPPATPPWGVRGSGGGGLGGVHGECNHPSITIGQIVLGSFLGMSLFNICYHFFYDIVIPRIGLFTFWVYNGCYPIGWLNPEQTIAGHTTFPAYRGCEEAKRIGLIVVDYGSFVSHLLFFLLCLGFLFGLRWFAFRNANRPL